MNASRRQAGPWSVPASTTGSFLKVTLDQSEHLGAWGPSARVTLHALLEQTATPPPRVANHSDPSLV
jgi:hypothetical protein